MQTKNAITRLGNEKDIGLAYQKIPFFDFFRWFDYFMRVCPALIVAKLKNTIVVTDRYAYDVILEIQSDDSKPHRLVEWLLNLFPEPKIVFFVKVPPALAFARKDDIPCVEFSRESEEAIQGLLKGFPVDQVRTLDGTGAIKKLTQQAFEITTALVE